MFSGKKKGICLLKMAATNRRPSLENEAFLKSRVKEVCTLQDMQDVIIDQDGKSLLQLVISFKIKLYW